MKTPALVALFSTVSFAALAQPAVPAVAANVPKDLQGVPSTMPPPINLLGHSAPLTPKERHAAALARAWRRRPQMPVRGRNGVVHYLYGATVPSVVCAPLYVCIVRLQPGEVVNSVDIGDSVRWKVSPAVSGSGANQVTELLIKPTDAGLRTNLVITTTRRVYTIKLVSTRNNWTPEIAFNYPSDTQSQWAAYHQRMQFQLAATTLPSGQNVSNLDFNYRIGGDDPSWRPLRVYTDGTKTYIDFPRSVQSTDAPALVELAGGGLFSSPTPKMVNYRVKGDIYVVDGVVNRAALIEGVGGSQTRVTITREASR